MGKVKGVAGSVCVASTIPGRRPPTVEPIPGNVSAALKVPLLALATGGPSCALNPGKPNLVPIPPAVRPNVPAEPPTNGYCTKGWSTTQHGTAKELRVWQVKARQVLGIIYLHPPPAVCFKEEFNVIVQPDVEAYRSISNINVPRVAIVIAICNTEREFTAA